MVRIIGYVFCAAPGLAMVATVLHRAYGVVGQSFGPLLQALGTH